MSQPPMYSKLQEATKVSFMKSALRKVGRVLTEGIIGLSLAARLAIPMGALHLACANEDFTYPKRDAQGDVGKLDAGGQDSQVDATHTIIRRLVVYVTQTPIGWNAFLWENGTSTQLTFDNYADSHASLCPSTEIVDGGIKQKLHVVFASNRAVPTEARIFAAEINLDDNSASNPVEISLGPNDTSPQCFGTATPTVFYNCGPTGSNVCSTPINGGTTTQVFSDSLGRPAFSPSPSQDKNGDGHPDELFVPLGSPAHINRIPLNNGIADGEPVQITSGSGTQTNPSASSTDPLVAFITTETGSETVATVNSVDGSELTHISNAGNFGFARIARPFGADVAVDSDNSPSGLTNISIMPITGGTLQLLIRNDVSTLNHPEILDLVVPVTD